MFNSFGEKFISQANETALDISQVTGYWRASDPSQFSPEEMKKTLVSDLENVILAVSPRKGDVVVLHSIKDFGGTLRRPESKVIGLTGLSNFSSPVEIDIDSLVSPAKFVTPTDSAIRNCTSEEQVVALEVAGGGTRSKLFENAPFVILPPHELKAIIQADSRRAFDLLAASIEANEAFNPDDQPDVAEEERVVLGERTRKFLFGVIKGLFEPVSLVVVNDDSEAKGHYLEQHTKFILPPIQHGAATAPSDVNSDTLKMLSINTAKMTESIDNQNALSALEYKRRSEAEEKKKDRTKSWVPDHIKTCIMNASSIDGERQGKLNTKFIDFMNSESAGQAGQKLLWDLNQSGFKNTRIADGVINSMYHGNIVSTNSNEMNAISSFSFSKRSPLQECQSDEYTLLHMSNTIGKAKSAEEIKASLARTVIVPKDFNEMVASFQRQNAVYGLIFTNESIITSKHKQFISDLAEVEEKIEEMLVSDPDICARIMYKAEIKTNLWFEECMQCDFRADIDDSLIDFNDIIRSIRLKDMQQRLPKCFKRVKENKRKRDDDKNNDGKPNKQPRTSENTGTFVENKEIIEGCTLHENENYRQVFLGKDKGSKRPDCSLGCKMCPKWLLKGGCWEDCSFVASHVPPSQFSEEERTAFKDWVAYCRSCS